MSNDNNTPVETPKHKLRGLSANVAVHDEIDFFEELDKKETITSLVDEEEYEYDIYYDEEEYEEEYESGNELPLYTADINSLRMQLVLELPMIVPQMKIPEELVCVDLKEVVESVKIDSFLTVRSNDIYFIDTGLGALQDINERNKAILYILVANVLRQFTEEVVLDTVTSEYTPKLVGYDTKIDLSSISSGPDFISNDYTVKHAAMDLVVYYMVAALAASKENKSISTNSIFNVSPTIDAIINDFVNSLANETAVDLTLSACKFVNGLDLATQIKLYSGINRNTRASLNQGYTQSTLTDVITKQLSKYNYDVYSSIEYMHSIMQDESNTRTNARGHSAGSGRGLTQRDAIFNTIKFLDVIDKLLNKLNKPSIFNRVFKMLKDSVALSISKTSVEVYADDLNSAISGLFKYDQSMQRPNRRYLSQDMILPSMVGSKVSMLFAIDYSGSITDIELTKQLGVIDSILSNHMSYEATILSFSDDIRTVVRLDETEDLTDVLVKFGENIGRRGGTSFQSVFDYIDGDEAGININELNLLCIVSADAAGGNITFSEKFTDLFNGKLLYLVDEYYKDSYIDEQYVNRPIGNVNFEREILYFVGK